MIDDYSDDSSRCKHLLTVANDRLSPDRSPQTRRGHRTSDNNSITVKFSDYISEIWSSMMLFNSEITIMILVLADDNSCLESKNHAFT